jgi:hypothetical protein
MIPQSSSKRRVYENKPINQRVQPTVPPPQEPMLKTDTKGSPRGKPNVQKQAKVGQYCQPGNAKPNQADTQPTELYENETLESIEDDIEWAHNKTGACSGA